MIISLIGVSGGFFRPAFSAEDPKDSSSDPLLSLMPRDNYLVAKTSLAVWLAPKAAKPAQDMFVAWRRAAS
jgi:hypothetical protein